MDRAPLLFPAVAFVLGIALEQTALAAAGAALACAALALPSGSPSRARIVALLAGLGISFLHGHPPAIASEAPTARYAATVLDAQRDENAATRVLLALPAFGAVRAAVDTPLAPGDRILVRGRLEPFDGPRNPGEPSLREIERADGIAGRLASAHVLGREPPDPRDPRVWAARLRAAAAHRLRTLVPEPAATILAGALWGERGTLPDDLRDAFQATGTVHVLVTAGLHLGVVAAAIVFVLELLGMPRALGCALAIVLILLYAWFAGGHLPSQRAAVMLSVGLAARACGARVVSWNALALAAIVVATLWPVVVTSASFALSFSCVAAILLFAEPLAARLDRAWIPHRIREALALTVATQLGTWPLTAAIFSTLAPYAILANAIVVPAVALALLGGIATLVLPPVAPLETLLLIAIERTVKTIAGLPGAHLTVAAPSAIAIAGYDLCALAAAAALRGDALRRGALLLGAGAAIVLLPGAIRTQHALSITHLDVGQADAAVIRTPSGRTILIDTGGELERGGAGPSSAERAGARIVLAYLRRAGIARIDLMLLTHPHGDHVGGAAPIIDAVPVGMIFDSGQPYPGRAYRDAIAAAHAHGVPVVLARRGMRWTSGDGAMLDVLAPSLPFLADTGDDVNENSIVVMLRYGAFRELFMGDAGEASEVRLLQSGDDLHADAIKVGHHGSRYASTAGFVAAVRPGIAVISVGRHNTFGHPATTTIDAWSAVGAHVLRTDRCGAICLVNGSPTSVLRCAGP